MESIMKTNTVLDQHPRYKAVFLYLLQTDGFVTSEQIGQRVGASARTIKNDLKIIRSELQLLGVELIAQKGAGYTIKQRNVQKYQKTRTLLQIYQMNDIPNEREERAHYILCQLIALNDFIKSETLLQELMLGKDSLSQELKIVKKKLQNYHLTLSNKPHYGLKIEGAFFNKLFLALHLYRYFHQSFRPHFSSAAFAQLFSFEETTRKKVRTLLLKSLSAENILLADIYLERFIVAVLMLQNLSVHEKKELHTPYAFSLIHQTNEWRFIKHFTRATADQLGISFTKEEREFLTFLTLVSVDLYRYVDCTYERYGLIYQGANELRTFIFARLQQYLNVRLETEQTFFRDTLKWSIPIATKIIMRLEDDITISVYNNELLLKENPLLTQILHYLAQEISKNFQYTLSQREKSVFYGLLLNTFESIAIEYKTMCLALVALDGRLGTQRLKFYLQRSFSQYIRSIKAKVMYELDEKNNASFDYYLCMEYGKNFDIKARPLHFVKESLDEVEYIALLKKVFMRGYNYDEQLPPITYEMVNTAQKMKALSEQYVHEHDDALYQPIIFGKNGDKKLFFSFNEKKDNMLKIFSIKKNMSDYNTLVIANLNVHDKQHLKMFMIALNTLIKYPEALKELTDKKQLNYDFIAYADKK